MYVDCVSKFDLIRIDVSIIELVGANVTIFWNAASFRRQGEQQHVYDVVFAATGQLKAARLGEERHANERSSELARRRHNETRSGRPSRMRYQSRGALVLHAPEDR